MFLSVIGNTDTYTNVIINLKESQTSKARMIIEATNKVSI